MSQESQDRLKSAELKRSFVFLLEVLADILAVGGPLFHKAWGDLRKLMASSSLLDPAEIKNHAFRLSLELSEIKNRLSLSRAEAPPADDDRADSGELTELTRPLLGAIASLRPSLEGADTLEEQLRNGGDPAEIFLLLTDFIYQIREDFWAEKLRTIAHIKSIMKKLETVEKSFVDSVAVSQSHQEKTERVFTQAVAEGLEEIGALIEPGTANLEGLCLHLSNKFNQLCEQVELKRQADRTRLELLGHTRRLTTRNLMKIRRDYESFNTQSHAMLKEIEMLRDISARDPLTGIYNRRAYDRQVAATLAAVDAGVLNTAALAVFDVDFFRNFNNDYGHLAGDRVLAHVARMVAETLRGDDLFFRYGGDEFVIIMPNTNLQAAVIVGEKVRRSLETVEFKIFKNSDLMARVNISVGVAEMENGDDAGQFFARADKALFMAKKGGRNQVVSEPRLDGAILEGGCLSGFQIA